MSSNCDFDPAAHLSPFRNQIMRDLVHRNRQQTKCFEDLITFNSKLFEQSNSLQERNLQLSVQIEKLQQFEINEKNSMEVKLNEKVQQLEQKIFQQQEELTQLHKKKGENSQHILDTNRKLQERDKELDFRNLQYSELSSVNENLKAKVSRYEKSLKDLDETNKRLLDEYQALELAYSSLNDKLRSLMEDNRVIQDKLMKYKNAEIERLNEENESYFKKKLTRRDRDRDRDSDLRSSLSPITPITTTFREKTDYVTPLVVEVPKSLIMKFEGHDSEINAVKWSPNGSKLLATGGADRKIKLWEVSNDGHELKKVLDGSNAAIMSVDFDSYGQHVLGASNDFACRMWSFPEWQLKKTYTGHSGKVLSAKFLTDLTKIVTGSHDRTLKLWDMNTITCVQTKFAGSSCNDLVITDAAGSTVISGHFDKKIRLWDTRAEHCSNDIVLSDKITSLDLSKDFNYLLSCVRDDTLKMIDLRTKKIVHSFSCDNFKVGCDWSRTAFSPDGQFASVGSANGSVYVWNVNNHQLEIELQEHTSAVTAVAWHPLGKYLVSVDRAKTVILWGNS